MRRSPLLLSFPLFIMASCGGGGSFVELSSNTYDVADETFADSNGSDLQTIDYHLVTDVLTNDAADGLTEQEPQNDYLTGDTDNIVSDVVETPANIKIRLVETQQIGANVLVFVSVVDATTGKAYTGLENSGRFIVKEDNVLVSTSESQMSVSTTNYVWRTLELIDTGISILDTGKIADVINIAFDFGDEMIAADTQSQSVAIAAFDGAADMRPLTKIGSTVAFVHDQSTIDLLRAEALNTECIDNDDCAALYPQTRPTCAAGYCVDTATNLNGSIMNGIALVEKATYTDSPRTAVPRIGTLLIVFDGNDSAAYQNEIATHAQIDNTKTFVYAIGVGSEINTATLIAYGKDGYESIASLDNLQDAVDDMLGRIKEYAAGLYVISYCTPKRSGTHTVSVSLDDPNKTISFDFVASSDATCDNPKDECGSRVCGGSSSINTGFYCGDCAGNEVCNYSSNSCEDSCLNDPGPVYECGFSPNDIYRYCGGCPSNSACNVHNVCQLCRNGVLEAGEECDDGNDDNYDACKNNCADNVCGDGVLNTGAEECDAGNANSYRSTGAGSCSPGCKSNPCDAGYTHNLPNGHCYKKFTSATSWGVADSNCHGEHGATGYLVTLSDAAESSWVQSNVQGGSSVWIGLARSTVDNNTEDWEWRTNDEGVPVYTNWSAGENSPAGGTYNPCSGNVVCWITWYETAAIMQSDGLWFSVNANAPGYGLQLPYNDYTYVCEYAP